MGNLLVFDNDGTLYDDSLAHREFMGVLYRYVGRLGHAPAGQVATLIDTLKQKWQTEFSVIAIMKEYGVTYSSLVENTYLKVDLDGCVGPQRSPQKRHILSALPGTKIVFTNNPAVFARRVLRRLDLIEIFSDVIGMEETDFIGKPNPGSFETIRSRYPDADILFCDDSLANLDAARKAGWATVWFRRQGCPEQDCRNHRSIRSFEELGDLL